MAAAASPAFAAGDAAKGEAAFKQCQTCHAVVNEAGELLAGKNSKTGPNLYGVIGRQIGTAADFKYGESIVAAGADGTVWDEAMLALYVTDPTAWLKEKTGDAAAKSKMSFKLAKGAEDMAAYLASVKPAL